MSQYKDQITGDILYDIRFYDKFGYTFGYGLRAQYATKLAYSPIISFDSSITKFSSKSLFLQNSYIGLRLVSNPFNSISTYTLSFWVYVLNYNSTSNPGAIGLVFPLNNIYTDYTTSDHRLISEHTRVIHYEVAGNKTYRVKGSSNLPTGSWHHVAFVKNNTNYKIFIDGNKNADGTNTNVAIDFNQYITFHTQLANSTPPVPAIYLDDIVIIANQALWTNNFTVPDTYLTGDHSLPKRISNKHIIKLKNINGSDYFDKAYLY